MRRPVDAARLREFMSRLAGAARGPARVYFSGGATAVLHGWRESTIDVDLVLVPERDELLRAIPELKERLEVNVELASPAHFLPEVPGWEARSPFAGREGALEYLHYDLVSQALAKIERGHAQDLLDVRAMLAGGHVRPDQLVTALEQIEPFLYRFPAVDPPSLRRALMEVVAQGATEE